MTRRNNHLNYTGRGKTWVENPAMSEPREISCLRYAASKLCPHSPLDDIDPEEIRRITRKMRRESYPIPKRPEQCKNLDAGWNRKVIREYLEHFGSMWTGELQRAGIEMRSVAYHCNSMPDVEGETLTLQGEGRKGIRRTYYRLKKGA